MSVKQEPAIQELPLEPARTAVGLDLGSGRVTCVLGSGSEDGMRVLAAGSVPCRGLRGGVVVNIQEAVAAINRAIEAVERESGLPAGETTEVCLGVRGNHLSSFNNRGVTAVGRTGAEITAEDIADVLENSRTFPLAKDREILSTIARSFELDGVKGVGDPKGMEGAVLGAEVHIVTGSKAHLNNLGKAVAEAGFHVTNHLYGVTAAGELVTTRAERSRGVFVIDLGGQTTSVAAFYEGSIHYSKELPVGCDFITSDLADGLGTTIEEAERLKLECAVGHPSFFEEEREVAYHGFADDITIYAKTSEIMDIVLPRLEQILTLAGEAAREAAALTPLEGYPAGVVLTGGGAGLAGIAEAAEAVLETRARVGRPEPGAAVKAGKFSHPRYATAIALAARGLGPGGPQRRRGWVPPNWARRAWRFWQDLL